MSHFKETAHSQQYWCYLLKQAYPHPNSSKHHVSKVFSPFLSKFENDVNAISLFSWRIPWHPSWQQAPWDVAQQTICRQSKSLNTNIPSYQWLTPISRWAPLFSLVKASEQTSKAISLQMGHKRRNPAQLQALGRVFSFHVGWRELMCML